MKKTFTLGLLIMSLFTLTGCDKLKEIEQVKQGLDTVNDVKKTIEDGKQTAEQLQKDINTKIEQGKELKEQYDEFNQALDTFKGNSE